MDPWQFLGPPALSGLPGTATLARPGIVKLGSKAQILDLPQANHGFYIFKWLKEFHFVTRENPVNFKLPKIKRDWNMVRPIQ